MLRKTSFTITCFVLAIATMLLPADAQQIQSEQLLPGYTQGVVTFPNLTELANAVTRSEAGRIFDNPEVNDFLADLETYLQKDLKSRGVQIDIDPSEILNTFTSEVSIAILRPSKKEFAFTFLAEISDESLAREFIERSRKQILKRGGVSKGTPKISNVDVSAIKLPPIDKIARDPDTMYTAIHKGWMISSNNATVMSSILNKLNGTKVASYSESDVYKQTMARLKQHSAKPLVRWFVKPFGLAETFQLRIKRNRSQTNYIKILKDAGFSQIEGIGGIVEIGTDNHEIVSQSFVYCPRKGGERFVGSGKMLDFTNGGRLPMKPEKWIPGDIASRTTFVWDIEEAFNAALPLVDKILGIPDGGSIKAIENFSDEAAKYNIRIDLKEDIIQKLGEKITLVTDSKIPAGPKSEKLLMAMSVNGNGKSITENVLNFAQIELLMKTRKDMLNSEVVVLHNHFGEQIYEFNVKKFQEMRSAGEDGGEGSVDIDIIEDEYEDEFEDEFEEKPKDEKNERLLKEVLVQKISFSVCHGHVFISNDLDYLKRVIKAASDSNAKASLSTQMDYQQIEKALDEIAEGADSMRRFGRFDRTYHATYDLFRKGTLPSSESFLGVILNQVLPKDAQGKVKKTSVDPAKLPENFNEDIAPYLGSFGWSTKTIDDGWLISMVVLGKKQMKENAEAEKSKGSSDSSTKTADGVKSAQAKSDSNENRK